MMRNNPSSTKIIFSPVGNRIAAIFIDGLMLLIPAYLITAIFPDKWGDIQGFKNLVAMSLFPIYNPLMESLGGTFGKKFVKSFTINLKTQGPPAYLTSLARFILSIVPIFVMGYGSGVESPLFTLFGIALLSVVVLPVFFTKRRQTLYDLLSNVVVIEFEPKENDEGTTSDKEHGYIEKLENRSSVFPTET